MRLVCPNCGKAHIVRPEALGSQGRTVRCAACKNTWAVTAAGETDYGAQRYAGKAAGTANSRQLVENIRSVAEGTAKAAPRPSRKKAPSKNFLQTVEPGAVILGGLVCFLGMMLFFREPVVETVPRLARLYETMGFHVNVRGLEFADIKISHESENGAPVLVVEGKITNITPDKRDVPPVRIALRSPTGSEIDIATVKAENLSLDHAGATNFKSRLANPPQDAKDVLVKFSSTGLQSGG
ncbi:MAG: MJ0042-type zinc finger domain-containing protein [Pseudomonadota bacterium]